MIQLSTYSVRVNFLLLWYGPIFTVWDWRLYTTICKCCDLCWWIDFLCFNCNCRFNKITFLCSSFLGHGYLHSHSNKEVTSKNSLKLKKQRLMNVGVHAFWNDVWNWIQISFMKDLLSTNVNKGCYLYMIRNWW